jgi:hypothetical protein
MLLLASACVRQSTPPETDTLPRSVRSIAVLPVGVMTESGAPPPTPQMVKAMAEGVAALDQIVAESLGANPKVRLLTAEEVDVHSKSYSASPMAQALAIGKEVGVEAVMVWGLVRYHERSGGDYGVQTPASVGFQYRLLHTASGRTLCAASFEETQQAGTDNLLALNTMAKRGFKWVPAPVLLREGVNKKMPECEYLRTLPGQEEEARPAAPAARQLSAPPVVSAPAPTPALQEVAPPAPQTPPLKAAATPVLEPTADQGAVEIARFLEQWRQAWEAAAGPRGDMEHFAAFYAPDFRTASHDRNRWLAAKGRINHGKEWIRVKISAPTITKSADGSQLTVRFSQEYSSSNFSETTVKSLVLRKNEGNWEIVGER